MTLQAWLDFHWADLTLGRKLIVPFWLKTSEAEGFHAISVSTPQGQAADWGLSLSDGSRLHVHVYLDGRRVVHRDKYDPDYSLGNLVRHLTLETALGPALVAVGVLALINEA